MAAAALRARRSPRRAVAHKEAAIKQLIDWMVGICLGVLLAAMALYGAVQIIASIWMQLTLCAAGVLVIGAIVWVAFVRPRRW